jgi:WD40 repeat protein
LKTLLISSAFDARRTQISDMASAKCKATSILGTAPDTYLYSLARSGNVFSTIGSDDSLRLFSPDLRLTQKVQSAHAGITCLANFGPRFVTGGRDGLVKCWDARAKQAGLEIAEPKGHGIASVACREHFIATGTESAKEGLGDVSVLIYDTRNASTPLRNYAESHTDTITQLAFNPDLPNVLLSGSTDGLVSIFDIEKQDEDDALMQVLNPRSAIHCCGFLRRDEVYALTTDEQLSLFKIGEATYDNGTSEIKMGDVREKLGCTYVVALTGTERTPVMAIGHNINQTLSIVPFDTVNPPNFGSAIDLPGAHGEEVVRDLMLLQDQNLALSCGEDGNVKLWDLPSPLARSGDAMEID